MPVSQLSRQVVEAEHRGLGNLFRIMQVCLLESGFHHTLESGLEGSGEEGGRLPENAAGELGCRKLQW